MQFDPCRCPECGDLLKGTCDIIPAIALVSFDDDDDDDAEFAGESEVLWDGQETPTNAEGLIDVICPSGHIWQAKLEA